MYWSTFKALLYRSTLPSPLLMFIVLALIFRTLLIVSGAIGSPESLYGLKDFPGATSDTSGTQKEMLWFFAQKIQVVASPDTDAVRKIVEHQHQWNYGDFIRNFTYTNDPFGAAVSLSHAELPVITAEFQKISKTELTYSLGYFPSNVAWPTSKMFFDNDTVFTFPMFYRQTLLPLQTWIDFNYMATYVRARVLRSSWRLNNMPHPNYTAASPPPKIPYQMIGHLPPHSLKLRSLFLNLTYGLLVILITYALSVTTDRASGMKDLLNANGAPRWMLNTSWLFVYMVATFVESGVLTICIKKVTLRVPWLWSVDGTFLFVVILTFTWSNLCAVNFLLALVPDPKMAPATTIVFVYLMNMMSAYAMVASRNTAVLFIVALFPSGSLIQILMAYQEYEKANVVLTFSNSFWTPIHTLPIGVLVITMIAGAVMYFFLALYVDAVMPSPHGSRKPWHLGCVKVQPSDETLPPLNPAPVLEGINPDVPIGLRTTRISKRFGRFYAVNDVSIEFVKNQITVLLGHNGAGKTTLFSMICGIMTPTSGKVASDQLNDVFEGQNMNMFRKSLGYCPQQNVLLETQNVRQHLILFGILKNMTFSAAHQESIYWAKTLGLENQLDSRVKTLSGGMKRRLCLAMAVMGHPEYLLLDEPTSGVDVVSQKQIWNFLHTMKKTCTIIITTHSMEEAEVLGDWVAIMSHGQLKCYGSVKFLKKTYGFGYKLNCAVDERRRSDLVKKVHSYIPSSQVVDQSDRRMVFELHVPNNDNLPNLLRDLDGNNIEVSLTYNTLGDVFVKLESEGAQPPTEETIAEEVQGQQQSIYQQMYSLFTIRASWACENWIKLLWLLFLYPIITFLISIFLVFMFFESNRNHEVFFPDLKLSFDEYKGATALIKAPKSNAYAIDNIKSVLSRSGISYKVINGDIVQTLENMMTKEPFYYRSKLVFAFEAIQLAEDLITLEAFYSLNALHSAPIAYAAAINALLNGNAAITTHYAPYAQHNAKHCHRFADMSLLLMAYMLAFCIMRLSAPFGLYPHEDRVSGFKHIQKMTKVSPLTYWSVSFIFDFALYLAACVPILIFLIADNQSFLFSWYSMLVFWLVMVMYGVSVLPSLYAFSFFFNKYSWNQAVTELLTFTGLIIAFLWASVTIILWQSERYRIMYFMPIVVFFESTYKIIYWTSNVSKCQNCKTDVSIRACEIIRGNTLLGSLQWELIWFAIDSLLYFAITFCLEEGLPGFIWNWFRNLTNGRIIYAGNIDPDVAAEKKRVAELPKDQAGLVCEGMEKMMRVYDVTFAVNRGECFGLLGGNGAGKSTTFGMLAGTVRPTKGIAFAAGHQLTACEKSRYLLNIGYCPQADCFNQLLSGQTLITHFARLRGIPEYHVSTVANNWLALLEMNEIADKPSKYYSGGNKRKVSVALALVGTPKVVLLDEPTTGVDIITKRRIWEIIKLTMKATNQTVLLSSHSMAECEYLCDRLAIIVGGALRCIGTLPSLKQKFGRKSFLRVTMIKGSSELDQEELGNKIAAALHPHLSLQERGEHSMGYLVSLDSIKLHDVFAIMIKIKNANPVLEDFNIGDASLEHIFQSFVNPT